MAKIISIFTVILLIPLNVFAKSAVLEWRPKRFSYEGHIFFNATNSAVQGERFLLNEQLSNIKLGSELQINDWNKTKGLLIYNTLPTPINPQIYFDQLYHEFKSPNFHWYFEGGRKWVTFGNYKNDLIYKPLTKALGQTNELTAVMGYDADYYMSLSLFSPYSRIRSSSLPYYNLNFGTHKKNYDIGGSYLYSLADSQIFQYNKGFGGFLKRTIHSKVPGFAAHANLNYKNIGINLTYVTAVRPFQSSELSYNKKGAIPQAFSIQSSYYLMIKKAPVKLIGFYEYSYETLALRIPKKRFGVGLSAYPKRYLTAQFQYFKDYEYSSKDEASGLNKTVWGTSAKVNTFALQLILNL
ncbi:LbtU family siderophore porin [Legionella tucsonensis]|uniref:Coiled-coil protein n=1 Tax=Legionella tucsonensis TaxID=40335 RepID=A0A0W0ZVG0_9GAMM|nr:LbtU family siderophore porin [Legionella tucsonensis]KTD73080.1 coiled-coil protein [Legionella tucsonensis]